MALKITDRDVGEVTVVEVDGRIVHGEEANGLRKAVKGLLTKGKKKLVLNLGNVTQIDSAGLGVLVGIRQSANSAGASMWLSNLGARYTDLLKLTQLWPLFNVAETETDAIRSIVKSPLDLPRR